MKYRMDCDPAKYVTLDRLYWAGGVCFVAGFLVGLAL